MTTPRPQSGRRPTTAAAVALMCALVVPSLAAAQSSGPLSAAAAKELAAALDAAKLDSIAAADPSDPQSFAAALYFPGAQLLVVSAKYSAPSLLLDKMSSRNYRDVYIDLNSASIQGSKVFIIDQRCDGLVFEPDGDQVADTYEFGASQVAFDGEWKKAKLSEEEYRKAFQEADAKYAKILALLTAQAKNAGSQ